LAEGFVDGRCRVWLRLGAISRRVAKERLSMLVLRSRRNCSKAVEAAVGFVEDEQGEALLVRMRSSKAERIRRPFWLAEGRFVTQSDQDVPVEAGDAEVGLGR